MKNFKKIKVGIISSITGENSKTGLGMLNSARYMLERKRTWLADSGLPIELLEKDDGSDPSLAGIRAEELINEGCVAIIGPTDSLSFWRLLTSPPCKNIALLSTIASASRLSTIGAENFFRFTTPDCVRAEMLVRHIRRIYNAPLVQVCALAGDNLSYGQQLKMDVVNELERNGMRWSSCNYLSSGGTEKKLDHKEPIIVCGQSSSVRSFANVARSKKIKSQMFTFGSNSNLLDDSLVGSIVVCDVDREDANPITRDEIDHFIARYPEISNPDVSTMNATFTLCALLVDCKDILSDHDIKFNRNHLIAKLRSGPHKAMFGHLTFSSTGEMVGHENISLLKIKKNKGKYTFDQIDRDGRAVFYKKSWARDQFVEIMTILGGLATLISLIQFIL